MCSVRACSDTSTQVSLRGEVSLQTACALHQDMLSSRIQQSCLRISALLFMQPDSPAPAAGRSDARPPVPYHLPELHARVALVCARKRCLHLQLARYRRRRQTLTTLSCAAGERARALHWFSSSRGRLQRAFDSSCSAWLDRSCSGMGVSEWPCAASERLAWAIGLDARSLRRR